MKCDLTLKYDNGNTKTIKCNSLKQAKQGIEYFVGGNYAPFKKDKKCVIGCTIKYSAKIADNEVKIKINYKF